MYESTQSHKLSSARTYLDKVLGSNQSSAQAARITLSFLAGAFSVLAYAPFHYWILAPLALMLPLFLGQYHKSKHYYLIWFAFGLGKFFIGSHWLSVSMTDFGGLPLLPSLLILLVFNAYQALYPMLAGWLLQRFNPLAHLNKTVMLFPVIWCFTEWLRGELLTGFPWLWDGYIFVDTPLISLAPYIGALGLTAVSALTATGLLALFCHKQYKIPFFMLTALAILSFLGHTFSPIHKTGEKVRVTLIQGNTPQSVKWNPSYLKPSLETHEALSQPYWDKTDLIIWSESALATSERRIQSYLYKIDRIAKKHNASLITGLIQHKNNNNSGD